MIELQKIQNNLKVNKSQVNTFGNYKYRSCEDILEAVKPLLSENGCVLTISDEIVQIGDRYYVKASVELKGQSDSVMVSAFAREALSKKGMDEAQITGACSSYARKYALNGLFCIDDTKDADTQDNRKEGPKMPKRADVKNALDKLNTLQQLANMEGKFEKKYGPDVWDQPSGNGSNKKETWRMLFAIYFKKLSGEPPVDANTTPDELQKNFENMVNTADSWATYDFVADMLEKNPALDNQRNIDSLLSLEHDLNERLGER